MRPAALLLAAPALVASQLPNPPHVTLPTLGAAPSMAADADLSTWKGALEITQFGMIMPDDKGVNRWPTIAHLAWGPDALYVAVEALDPDPSQIHAFRHKRDEFADIDFVGLDLDSTGKGQAVIRLLVTPFGGQLDGIATDNGEDYSYDCLWDSVGVLTAKGYLVKYRVPYSSLRRAPGEWAVRVLRVIPRERRYGISWPPISNDVQCNVCQAAKASGAPVTKPGSPFLVIPTVSATRGQILDEDPSDPTRTHARLGMDLRYSGTSATLEGTYRPDFNNVDQDVDPLQINSRFKVFYPEKRPFFLEGMDLLGVQGAQRQFFSRTILDPLYGVKYSGTDAWASWTVLNAKDQNGGAMVDSFSADGGPAGVDALPSRDTAAAARFRLDDMGSGLSFLGTDKRVLGGADRYGGQSGGIYWTQHILSEWQLVGSAIQSVAQLPEPDGTSTSQRGNATALELDWNSRNAYAWASVQGTSPGLELVSGFTDLQGYRRQGAGIGWQDRWNQGRLAQASLTLRGYSLEWWDGNPMDRAVALDGYLETKGRFSVKMTWQPLGRTWADDEVNAAASRSLALNLRWNRYSWAQTYVFANQGRTIDLDSAVPARSRAVGLGASGNVGSLAYTFTLQRSDLDQEGTLARLVRAREAVLGAIWSLPASFYVKTQAFVVRYDGSEEESVDKFVKVFLGWQPNAFTNAYFGWSGQRRRDPENGIGAERVVQRGLFAKLAYAIQF